MTKSAWNKNKSVGQKIKQRREQLNLSPQDLSSALKMTKQQLWTLENKTTRPSADVLFRVANALDTSILYFLTECELNDVDEDILLTKFRKLTPEDKKLAIEIVKLMERGF